MKPDHVSEDSNDLPICQKTGKRLHLLDWKVIPELRTDLSGSNHVQVGLKKSFGDRPLLGDTVGHGGKYN